MANPFLPSTLLVLLFLGGGLGAQPVATEPMARFHSTHALVYLKPDAPNAAKVLAPPPAPGSLAAEADLEAVRMAQSFRTPEQVAWAQFIEEDGVFKHAPEIGSWFTPTNLPKCDSFFARALGDSRSVGQRAKRLFFRPRPPKVDSGIRPCVFLPGSSSYPSSHSTQAFTMALILADLFPEKREALLNRAHRAAWSRIIGGVHYPSDDVAGRLLAQAIVAELRKNSDFIKDLEACRKEINQVKARQAKP